MQIGNKMHGHCRCKYKHLFPLLNLCAEIRPFHMKRSLPLHVYFLPNQGNIETDVRQSVCHISCPYYNLVTRARIAKKCTSTYTMSWCYLVFDIDGMLFDFV